MMKWKVLGGAVAVLSVGVLGLTLLPATGQTGGKKFILCEKNGKNDYDFDIDNPPDGFSAGDQFVFSEPEYNENKQEVGKIVGSGIVIRLQGDDNALVQFNVSFNLDGGRIEAQGSGTFRNLNNANLAIIGGSGKYNGATGTVSPNNNKCEGFKKGDSATFKLN